MKPTIEDEDAARQRRRERNRRLERRDKSRRQHTALEKTKKERTP